MKPDMPFIPNSLINLNGNLLCAVDVETTGRLAGYHEIIQIGIQPLSSDIKPMKDVSPFYMNIAPKYPERVERAATRVHGLDIDDLVANAPDSWRAADLFDEWFQRLDLPFKKNLVPLAQNWAKGMPYSTCFDCTMRHLTKWWYMGEELDAESGEHHIDMALCNLLMLKHYMASFREGDDRPGQELTRFSESLEDFNTPFNEEDYLDRNPAIRERLENERRQGIDRF